MSDQPRPSNPAEQLARKHGVDLDQVGPAPEQTGCLACDTRDPIEEIPAGLVSLLCADHAEQLQRLTAERVLRPVIPEELHDAKPSHLLPQLQKWHPGLGGVYLYGPVGTGKSHQAAALLKVSWAHFRRVRPERAPRVAWRNVPIMMDDIAATFGNSREYPLAAVRDADVLVLDDIGLGDSMPFAVRKLYAILEHRLNARLTTIVTSNRDLDELERHLESPQVASRLSAMCAQVPFEGLPDRRPDLAPRLE